MFFFYRKLSRVGAFLSLFRFQNCIKYFFSDFLFFFGVWNKVLKNKYGFVSLNFQIILCFREKKNQIKLNQKKKPLKIKDVTFVTVWIFLNGGNYISQSVKCYQTNIIFMVYFCIKTAGRSVAPSVCFGTLFPLHFLTVNSSFSPLMDVFLASKSWSTELPGHFF